MHRLVPLVCLATLALEFASSALALAQRAAPLTSAERATLRQGQLVVRPSTERRGPLRLFGGTSFIVVDLPVDATWRALNDDSSRYRHMLPQVAAATERSRANAERTIRFEHDVGPVSAAYSLDFEYNDENKTVMFRLNSNEPHDIRAAWGYFRLIPTGNQTLISFGAMLDVGDGMLTGALQSRLHEWVLKIPWTFKRYVEGRGRRRYAR